jgi:hypothetical protein
MVLPFLLGREHIRNLVFHLLKEPGHVCKHLPA